MLHFCKKYELDQSRTHLLLHDLEAAQRDQMYELAPEDYKEISIERRQKRIDRYGDYLVIALCIPYLNSDATLVNLLHLNQNSHACLKRLIYQTALLNSEPDRLKTKRKQIWLNILDVPKLRKNVEPYE